MPPLADTLALTHHHDRLLGDEEDSSEFSGYVEVKAIEDPSTGIIKDEIIIVLPLSESIEKTLDEDPLYYYPPSTPKSEQIYLEESSDSDDEGDDDDYFDDNPRPIITNRHKNVASSKPNVSTDLEYSFMEELMQTLDNIFGCSYSGCTETITHPVLKSALRRKGSSDTVPPINRNVSFTKLEIREFNMTLGDHPSAVTGPPVMLDWDARPTREAVIDLDSYEKARQPRRTRRELKLSFEARRRVLENDRGFTVEEVKKAWSEALKIRKQRQETRLRGPHQQLIDEIWESACRKYNRIFDWKLQ